MLNGEHVKHTGTRVPELAEFSRIRRSLTGGFQVKPEPATVRFLTGSDDAGSPQYVSFQHGWKIF